MRGPAKKRIVTGNQQVEMTRELVVKPPVPGKVLLLV